MNFTRIIATLFFMRDFIIHNLIIKYNCYTFKIWPIDIHVYFVHD